MAEQLRQLAGPPQLSLWTAFRSLERPKCALFSRLKVRWRRPKADVNACLETSPVARYETMSALRRLERPLENLSAMPARILIVEDEMLVALELECILADLGHEAVGIVPDLETAHSYFDTAIDLALVDLNLRDGLTGPQIGKALSANGVSVVFITANPRLLNNGIAGTIGVITKPTDEQTVKAAVDYALGVREGRAVSPPPALKLFG